MDKQIEEVFESALWEILYNNGCSEKVGVKIAEEIIDVIKNAHRNGDLYLKSDIERARIEGKIEGIKAVKNYCFESDTIPLTRLDFYSFTESILETLETKLKELK